VSRTGRKKDTRKHKRQEAVLRVSYRDVEQLVDYTENLSKEGVFIATERQFEPGAQIMFELSFPGLFKPIRLRGEVIWRRPPESLGEVRPPGIGVRLEFADELERKWLHDLLQKLTGDAARAREEASSYAILLAEDNTTSRAMFLEALRQENMADHERLELLETDTTWHTWETLQREKVDLLIIEWRMCMEGNLHILEKIRTEEKLRGISVLVLGSTRKEEAEALAAGADVFLRRPFPAKGLIRTVRSLMSDRGRQVDVP
jgi:uncharacterized protein (TIGR02266 family)